MSDVNAFEIEPRLVDAYCSQYAIGNDCDGH